MLFVVQFVFIDVETEDTNQATTAQIEPDGDREYHAMSRDNSVNNDRTGRIMAFRAVIVYKEIESTQFYPCPSAIIRGHPRFVSFCPGDNLWLNPSSHTVGPAAPTRMTADDLGWTRITHDSGREYHTEP